MKHLAPSVKVAYEDMNGQKKTGQGGLLVENPQN
jgi:hypothetical protein